MKKIMVDRNSFDESIIKQAALSLREGKIVALPTETVYGLGAVCDNQQAVNRLYQIKKRPTNKPFTICVPDKTTAKKHFAVMPPFGYRILDEFWPGPLTIIFYAPGGEKKIGIRIPSHKLVLAVLKELGASVCLPSANISGEKNSLSAEEVEQIFGDSVDLIIDAGKSELKVPSTVVDLTYHPFKVLREGRISAKDLMMVFFRKRIVFVCTGNTCRSPLAEYMLKRRLSEIFPYLEARYDIVSRGIISLGAQPAHYEISRILKEKEGIDPSSHISTKLDKDMILSSDIFIVMEEMHKDYIIKTEPTAESRIFPLRKFLPSEYSQDIIDPISKPVEVYEKVYFLLDQAINELIEWL